MRSAPCGLLLFALATGGCSKHNTTDKPVGGDLPVTSSNSVALPGATDAADAPHAPAVAESRDANLTAYSDPRAGVRFDYPAVWRPAHAGEPVPAPDFTALAGAPRITQVFLPTGTVYQQTTLQALSFSYTVVPRSTAASCAALPAKALQDATGTATPIYNGVTYSEARGGDAGACHQLQAVVDSTRRGSQCLVFERDFATTCPYTQTQSLPRPLTPAEDAALHRHLDAIMQSVQISPEP